MNTVGFNDYKFFCYEYFWMCILETLWKNVFGSDLSVEVLSHWTCFYPPHPGLLRQNSYTHKHIHTIHKISWYIYKPLTVNHQWLVLFLIWPKLVYWLFILSSKLLHLKSTSWLSIACCIATQLIELACKNFYQKCGLLIVIAYY